MADERVSVRYIVDDVPAAIDFYTSDLGFTVLTSAAPAFADVARGNLRLLLNKRFKIVLATPSAIHAVIKKQFGLGAETLQRLREERSGLAPPDGPIRNPW